MNDDLKRRLEEDDELRNFWERGLSPGETAKLIDDLAGWRVETPSGLYTDIRAAHADWVETNGARRGMRRAFVPLVFCCAAMAVLASYLGGRVVEERRAWHAEGALAALLQPNIGVDEIFDEDVLALGGFR